MEKKRYYVSVGAKTVMENQGDSAYELEIEATPDEVQQLIELFESETGADVANMLKVHTPRVVKDDVVDHDEFDRHLIEVYRKLYELGTPETKAHIESMNILPEVQSGAK